MNDTLFYIMAILLFISGCVIIFQNQRSKRLVKDFEDKVNNDLLVRWDEEYRSIVGTYGSAEEFVKAHRADYNIIRSNILIFIAKLEKINKGLGIALDCLINDDELCKDKIMRIKIESIKRSVVSTLTEMTDDAKKFIKSEEEAHNEEPEMDTILKKLDKEVKDINFYE